MIKSNLASEMHNSGPVQSLCGASNVLHARIGFVVLILYDTIELSV